MPFFSNATSDPITCEPYITGPRPLARNWMFMFLCTKGLIDALQSVHQTDLPTVYGELARLIQAEFEIASTIPSVAQTVVDRIARNHHDAYMTSEVHDSRREACQQLEDLTLLVINFNMKLRRHNPARLLSNKDSSHLPEVGIATATTGETGPESAGAATASFSTKGSGVSGFGIHSHYYQPASAAAPLSIEIPNAGPPELSIDEIMVCSGNNGTGVAQFGVFGPPYLDHDPEEDQYYYDDDGQNDITRGSFDDGGYVTTRSDSTEEGGSSSTVSSEMGGGAGRSRQSTNLTSHDPKAPIDMYVNFDDFNERIHNLTPKERQELEDILGLSNGTEQDESLAEDQTVVLQSNDSTTDVDDASKTLGKDSTPVSMFDLESKTSDSSTLAAGSPLPPPRKLSGGSAGGTDLIITSSTEL